MTAKEANDASKLIAEQQRAQKQRLDEEDRQREKQAEEYERVGAVNFLLQEFHSKYLLSAIADGKRAVTLAPRSSVTAELVKVRLIQDGFTVSGPEHEYHDAYAGSSDDGFAYAYDGYSEWKLVVSW